MPFLLYTYLFTEIISPFLASLLILGGILFFGQLLPVFDLMVNFGITLPDFIRLTCYLVPNIFIFAVPMAAMLAVTICFSKLVNDNEMLALKAAGISLWRMLPPIIIFGICCTIITGYCATTLRPAGTIATKKLFFKIAAEKFDRGIVPRQFSEGIKNIVIHVDQVDPETKKWHGIYIVDTRQADQPLTILAATGDFSGSQEKMLLSIRLENGSIHQARGKTTQTIQFGEYILNLPLEHPKFIGKKNAAAFGKNAMNQKELLEEARKYAPDSTNRVKLLIEYHKRLALAWGCLILSILGLPLALGHQPGQRTAGVPLALSVFIIYYVIFTAGKIMAESGIPVAFAMWSPNAIFTILAFILLRLANREIPGRHVAADGLNRLRLIFTGIGKATRRVKK